MRSLLFNLRSRYNIPISSIKKVGLFAIVFGLVKINSVGSVFILANLSSSIATFGMIDYALALGLILAVPANAGLPGAYPYFILKKKQLTYESAFFFHGWVLSCLFLLFNGVVLFFDIPILPSLQLTLIIAAIFSLQVLAAVMLKSKERIYSALIFEAGFFLLLNAYNLYLFISSASVQLEVLQNCCLGYLLLLNLYFFRQLDLFRTFDWLGYKQVLKFGWPLITSSLLVIILTGSARIIIERLISVEIVGVYGLYFRLAAMIVLLFQIVNIVFFKKIYTCKSSDLDRWFQSFLFFIALVSLMFSMFIPFVVLPFLEIVRSTWPLYKYLYYILSFQMFFWIALALFENVIYRENLSRSCNYGLLGLILTMLLLVIGIEYFFDLNVMTIAAINTFTIYLACEWQMHLLAKANFHFSKTKKLLRFSALLFLFSFLIN